MWSFHDLLQTQNSKCSKNEDNISEWCTSYPTEYSSELCIIMTIISSSLSSFTHFSFFFKHFTYIHCTFIWHVKNFHAQAVILVSFQDTVFIILQIRIEKINYKCQYFTLKQSIFVYNKLFWEIINGVSVTAFSSVNCAC
jgi:hypothetical protein